MAPPSPRIVSGSGLDLQFEKSSLLAETFYRSPELLLQQVSASGAMGVNRGWEAAVGKGEWFIDEQRFGNTLIGAGINRNRRELLDAGLRAFEWGFAQQLTDGGFGSREPVVSTAYFVAAVAHSHWLLEAAGQAAAFQARLSSQRSQLARAALWLERIPAAELSREQLETHSSRQVVLGYALAMAGRVVDAASVARAGERRLLEAMQAQQPNGVLPERGGFDVHYQAEALVYLLRGIDHAVTAGVRRELEGRILRALGWLETRIGRDGSIQTAGSTRTGSHPERDRTGQPRRVSLAPVVRAFGLARYVFAEPRYEALARRIATARQAT